MTNPTALKFGYPDTQVAETAHWHVLVRPQQPTFGSLVLVCKDHAEAFAEISPGAFADLGVAVAGIETVLTKTVGYQRINYLMLMMVDRDVHFHVIPRYEGIREDAGFSFPDTGWPGPAALSPAVALDAAQSQALAARLAALWPSA
jgi:diadenosine tetraphosphate (Ap4A) HIT family hydrolase